MSENERPKWPLAQSNLYADNIYVYVSEWKNHSLIRMKAIGTAFCFL